MSCHPDPPLASCSARVQRLSITISYRHTYRHTSWWVGCPDPSLTPSFRLITIQVTHVPRPTIAWLDRCTPIRRLAKQDMPHVFQDDSRLHACEISLSRPYPSSNAFVLCYGPSMYCPPVYCELSATWRCHLFWKCLIREYEFPCFGILSMCFPYAVNVAGLGNYVRFGAMFPVASQIDVAF